MQKGQLLFEFTKNSEVNSIDFKELIETASDAKVKALSHMITVELKDMVT